MHLWSSWRCWPGLSVVVCPHTSQYPVMHLWSSWRCWPGLSVVVLPHTSQYPVMHLWFSWRCWPGLSVVVRPHTSQHPVMHLWSSWRCWPELSVVVRPHTSQYPNAPLTPLKALATPSLRSFPDVAFETVPVFVWLTMTLSRSLKEEPDSTQLGNQRCLWNSSSVHLIDDDPLSLSQGRTWQYPVTHPTLPLKQFQCSSDQWRPYLVLPGKNFTVPSYAPQFSPSVELLARTRFVLCFFGIHPHLTVPGNAPVISLWSCWIGLVSQLLLLLLFSSTHTSQYLDTDPKVSVWSCYESHSSKLRLPHPYPIRLPPPHLTHLSEARMHS